MCTVRGAIVNIRISSRFLKRYDSFSLFFFRNLYLIQDASRSPPAPVFSQFCLIVDHVVQHCEVYFLRYYRVLLGGALDGINNFVWTCRCRWRVVSAKVVSLQLSLCTWSRRCHSSSMSAGTLACVSVECVTKQLFGLSADHFDM